MINKEIGTYINVLTCISYIYDMKNYNIVYKKVKKTLYCIKNDLIIMIC